MICNHLRNCYANGSQTCKQPTSCLEQNDNRKNVTCEERKKRYNLENDKVLEVAVYHVDGGIVINEPDVAKCDYLYVVKDSIQPTVIMIELKGKDIHHALEQLNNSVRMFFRDFPRHRIYARIICKSVPRLYNDPSVKKCKDEFRKRFQGSLRIEENSFSEKYSLLS